MKQFIDEILGGFLAALYGFNLHGKQNIRLRNGVEKGSKLLYNKKK